MKTVSIHLEWKRFFIAVIEMLRFVLYSCVRVIVISNTCEKSINK